jgi:hypothetical protein
MEFQRDLSYDEMLGCKVKGIHYGKGKVYTG